MPITLIRYLPYLIGVGAILVAVSYVGWIHHDRNSIKAEFAAYKETINDQVQKNKAEAARQKERQDAEYQSAQTAHEGERRRLAAIIKRLRDAEGVSGGDPVPVADGGCVAVPTSPENPAGSNTTTPPGAGVEQTPFYEAAMMDTLQCRDLMRFVKTLHCVVK